MPKLGAAQRNIGARTDGQLAADGPDRNGFSPGRGGQARCRGERRSRRAVLAARLGTS